MKELVDKFLSWPLPRTVCADTCATTTDYPHPRSGTNLLNAAEAEEMLNHVVGDVLKEREALRAELEQVKSYQEAADRLYEKVVIERNTLLVERKKLRAALEAIAQPGLEPFKMPESMLTYAYILDMARNALNKKD